MPHSNAFSDERNVNLMTLVARDEAFTGRSFVRPFVPRRESADLRLIHLSDPFQLYRRALQSFRACAIRREFWLYSGKETERDTRIRNIHQASGSSRQSVINLANVAILLPPPVDYHAAIRVVA